MLKAFKYRLYPTPEQSVLLNKHIGSSRFVYNLALECKQMAWAGNRVNLNCFDLIKQLPELKKECEWLKEINSQSLQQPIRNLDNAFTRFFKGQGNFPKFKKKSNGGSFNVPQNVYLENGKLIIPKFKKGIDIVLHRPIKGEIRQATISKTPTGKYFVSILCETGENVKTKATIKENTSVGIDLGIKTFLVTSDGECFDNPKFLRESLSKLKYLQRKFSKNKGKRTKNKLAKLHEKVSNQRKDFLHKTSSKLISDNQTICIEDLNVKGMLANHKLALSISDCGWSMFVDMLEYKAEWYGKNILKIGRFEPSSKLCSCCGSINKELTLKDREWTCSSCNALLDRDVNASINIKNFALKNHLSVGRRLKNRNELPTLVGVMTSEAHSALAKGSFTMIRQQESIRRSNVYQATKHKLANKHYKTKITDVFNEVAMNFGYEPRSVSNIYYEIRKQEEKELGQIRASKKLGSEIARWFTVNVTKWHELSLYSDSSSYIKKEFTVNEFPNAGEYSFEFLVESNYTVVKSGDGKNEPITTDVIINSYSLELTKVYNADGEEIILQQKYIQEIEDHLYSILKLSIDYHK